MKIISGKLHGRNLKTPKGLTTRPVIARVREALFNVLGDMSGARVLDLFAGTGAIGIEAISRGAESAVFVDSGAEQCAVIRRNLDTFGVSGEVVRMDVYRALGRFSRAGQTFDFIFADPPYLQGHSRKTLDLVCERGLLAPRGIMAITVRKSEELPERSGECEMVFDRRYGDTRMVMYGRRREETEVRSQESEEKSMEPEINMHEHRYKRL